MTTAVDRCVSAGLRVINAPRRCAMAVVGLWVACSLAYAVLEGQGPVEGLWWGIVTASTVGYGDYSPATTTGRFVGMVLIVGMWFLTLAAAALYTARAVADRDAFTHEEQLEAAAKADRALAAAQESLAVSVQALETVRRIERLMLDRVDRAGPA